MKDRRLQVWPDGTRVRFTEKARAAMSRDSIRRPLPTPANGADAIYTIDNVPDPLSDVILRETGERWGHQWLEEVKP